MSDSLEERVAEELSFRSKEIGGYSGKLIVKIGEPEIGSIEDLFTPPCFSGVI